MSDGLQVSINTIALQKQLAALGRAYGFTAKEIATIESRSVNDTLSHMRSFTSKGIRSMYYVKKKDVDASMTMEKAKPRSIVYGQLSFQADKNIPLAKFGAKQGKNAVSVKVLKSSRMRRIQSGGKQQILQTQKNKRAAVWIAKGQILVRSEKSETPIMLWGPSFMAYFSKPSIAENLQTEANAWLNKRFTHHVNVMIDKKKSN